MIGTDRTYTPKSRTALHEKLDRLVVDSIETIRVAMNARKPIAMVRSGYIIPATVADLWALYGADELVAFVDPRRYRFTVELDAPDALGRYEARRLTREDADRCSWSINNDLTSRAEQW